jgi:hypothetical protein
MGTILASEVIAMASELAQDESNIVWTQPQALAWLNDGQRAATLIDPSVYVETSTIRLSAGTRQQITGLELLAVVRNMGTDGVTPGSAVRLVDRGIKDEFNPGWHTDTATDEITEYMFDDRVRNHFYVYPPQPNPGNYIEVTQGLSPPAVADINDPITINDSYAPALIEFIVFRFFSRDAEEASVAKAASHAQMFASLLGKKVEMDALNSPKTREHLS